MWMPGGGADGKGLERDRRHHPGRHFRGLGALTVERENQELFAAPADQAVGLAQKGLEPPGRLLEHRVAGGVPENVVHGLEMVEVEAYHSRTPFLKL